ncbi:TonB-dependent receptor [Coprobacter tertius]|uniref:TonB-dependent receptor n=1 Tax=Coprobacter tertius TaxID=2944915 RepID=A0ABT1MGK4_9BACT|nr:TonB-dependent receptor [Coprobacter tertius]MCP9611752.1 TonB-dependent receptor [Coprobacter tertius]
MLQIYEFIVKQAKIRKSFILFFCLLFLQAPVFAQSGETITIKKQKITVIEALQEVARQAHMYVGYNASQLKDKPDISLNIEKETLQQALSRILKGTGFSYRIKDRNIAIVPDNKPETETIKKLVTGKVTDESGEPLIGVSVAIMGSTMGVITDVDGKFSIEVPVGSTLTLSYVGFKTQHIKINDRNIYDIKMLSDTKQLNDVVVTALGIKREQKALSYNVQQVKSDDFTQIKDANFINSLAGKVAGATINTSSSGVGGASKVVMRGAKSIEQSSNALYVIDGIPMYNFGGNGGTEFDSRGTTEAIADLNPDDIESISVLTGAAAAALYGSNAANGAILITTKKGKVGKAQITVSSNTDFLKPFVLPRFQNRYGTGSNGNPDGSTSQSWGPLLNQASYRGYTPNEFFETGIVYTNSITLSAGTEKNQSFFSAASVNSDGMIPNNRYNRFNFTFRNTTSFLNDKMKLDVGAGYIIQNDRNMTNQGVYSNPLVPAYLFPRGDDFSLIKSFERWDPARKIMTMFWPQGEGDLRMQNPYWIAYRNLRENNKKRYMLSAQLSYDITDWINITGRVRVDNTNGKYEQKLYASSNPTLTEGSSQGYYAIETNENSQTYADVLLNINKRFGDYSLVANIGASITDNASDALSYRGPIREKGIPNVFNVFDLDNSKKRARQEGWEEQTQSVFASAELGWKSMIYLSLTGRNDWASQLANSPQSSFFYPSIGLSAIISQMAKMPEEIEYLKVRASFSSVGTPYPRFLTIPTYEYNETTQSWSAKTHFPIGKLYPERTDSWEVGIDARFLKGFTLSASFYRANTYNQTFDPKISVSSGYSKIYLQTGYVRNTGIEAMLGYRHDWNGFTWDTGLTFSKNQNKIIELVDNYIHPETGQPITLDKLEMKALGKAKFILKKGGTLGDLYTTSGLKRDEKGQIEIDNNGNVTTVDNLEDIKLGSVFPKCNFAWHNQFSYRGISLSALFTARIGGIVYSATQAALDQYGVSETSAAARDAGYVLVNGRSHIDPQTWYTAIASQSGLPQYYTYSATNIRLQELSIGYTIPRRKLKNLMDINIAFVGRNLWMIYNKAPFDPESVATTGNYYQGIDYFMMPSTRNLGFNIKINF